MSEQLNSTVKLENILTIKVTFKSKLSKANLEAIE